jgi:putative tricarboxylic transport membrane protein
MTDATPDDVPVAADPAPAATGSTPTADDPSAPPGAPASAVLLGGVAVALGVVVLADAARIEAPAGQSFVGPAAFPVGVGILLIGTGGALAGTRLAALVRTAGRTRPGLRRLAKVAALLGLLIGYAVLLPRLSYVLSTEALFTGAALLFGSGHRLRTTAIGVALAAVAFLGFSRGIGVSLPAGPWGF